MKKVKLQISGMHCASCEKIIQMDLSDIAGVIDSKIDSKTSSGLVEVEDSVSEELIIKTINNAGYQAQIVKE